jgi:hypothetical protein
MRNFTALEEERVEILTKYSIEITVLEPTRTGLEKSILDATGPVRNFLKNKDIHDYNVQSQGVENKVTINAHLILSDSVTPSLASLYRPNTKKGDPRIWFKGLPGFSDPNDLIGIFTIEGELYLVNLSKLDIDRLIHHDFNNPLREIALEISGKANLISNELLTLLIKIGQMGPVPAMLNADTAIGRTLEKMLGIDINSSKQPDYKGIELKAYRDQRDNRKNLFAQVPDWKSSKFKSSAEILNNFGYVRGEDFKLYCSVSTKTRNSQGLQLKVDQHVSRLLENSDKLAIGDFICWPLEILHARLLEKHNETFWISADATFVDGNEFFHFKKVEHTKKPIISQFDILLEQGAISVDHLIKRNSAGKVVEKGPLFKIAPKSLNLLFPPSQTYSLL